LGPQFVGRGDTPDFGQLFSFQIAVSSEHVADFGGVPFSELGRLGGKRRKKEKSMVKQVSRQVYLAA